MATGTTGRKFLRSFFGLLIWLSRPHRGIAAFYGGGYAHLLWGRVNQAYTPRSVLDALASGIFFALKPFQSPRLFPPSHLILHSVPTPDLLDLPIFLFDGGPDGYGPTGRTLWRVGLFSPDVGTRTKLVGEEGHNQQFIELLAFEYAIRLAVWRGYPRVLMGSDSLVAIAQILRLRAGVGLKRQQRVLRSLVRLLTKSRLLIVVIWIPTAFQPGDPLSRVNAMCGGDQALARRKALVQWGELQDNWGETRVCGSLSLFT